MHTACTRHLAASGTVEIIEMAEGLCVIAMADARDVIQMPYLSLALLMCMGVF
jgi:hypothetical protein